LFTAEPTQAEWRASVVRIAPAAVRTAGELTRAAAPRYADVPTPSRIWERAEKEEGSV
jgi:hypothetical protein